MCILLNNFLVFLVLVELVCLDLYNWKIWFFFLGILILERSYFGVWLIEFIGYWCGLNFLFWGSCKCECMILIWDLGYLLVVLVWLRFLLYEKYVFFKFLIMFCGFNCWFFLWLRFVYVLDWIFCNVFIYWFCSWKVWLCGFIEVCKILFFLDFSCLLDYIVFVWCCLW